MLFEEAGSTGKPGEPIDDTYYKILGVDVKATRNQIKKAYNALVIKNHPDKGGDREEFEKVREAWAILGDEEKRAAYDIYGKGGASQVSKKRSKPPPVTITIDLTLSDVCRGPERSLEFYYSTNACSTCGGRGIVDTQVQIGPMVGIAQQACGTCDGKGYSDSKMVKMTKKVRIPKGIASGQNIRLSGEGHQLGLDDRGDVEIICRVARDPMFERRGADLAMKKQLSLKDALCGFAFKIKHPSGTMLTVRSKAGEMVNTGMFKKLTGWGLPQKGAYDVTGNLFMSFDVLLPVPGSVTPEKSQSLAKILETLTYPKEKEHKILTFGKGARVKLNVEHEEMNGRLATILADERSPEGFWPIQFDDDSGQAFAIPESYLELVKIESVEIKSSIKDEDDADKEDVTLEDVKGGMPQFTPGDADEGREEEEAAEEGGAQQPECQSM